MHLRNYSSRPQHQGSRNAWLRVQIMTSLSSDLAIRIMQATNATLPTLFSSLPDELHPLALRTHIPSIDCNHQICIEHQHLSSLSLTMVLAASSIHNLTQLAFHQRHLLPESLHTVFSAVANLTNLQALSVAETQMGREGVRRLAPLLCNMPYLRNLDVSQVCGLGIRPLRLQNACMQASKQSFCSCGSKGLRSFEDV
jgi:hypothetical protein